MIRIFLKHAHVAPGRFVSASARRNRTIGDDLISDHEVSPLLRNRNDDARVVRRCLIEHRLIHFQRVLLANEIGRLPHGLRRRLLLWRRSRSKKTYLSAESTCKNSHLSHGNEYMK